MTISFSISAQNLFNFVGVGVHYIFDSGYLGRLGGKGHQVIPGDVLQAEFAGAAHELAQSLGQALEIGIDAYGSHGQLVKGIRA